MATIQWIWQTQPQPGRHYLLAATTGLRIKPWNPIHGWRFMRYTNLIRKRLETMDGCLGYALRVTLFPFNGATLTVWDTPESLHQFQREHPHATAVKALKNHTTGPFQFTQWTATTESLPKTWNDVTHQFQQET